MKAQRHVRGRVRTQWMALAGALVVLAGVLVAWSLSNAADRVQVVQVARAVHSGHSIQSEDLVVTGVAYDAPVNGLVPAASLAALVGRVAAVDLAPGLLMQKGMWRDAPALGIGEQAVGAVLKPGRLPAGLTTGDRAVAAPLQPGDPGAPVPVRVVDITVADDGTATLSLAVPDASAVAVAQLAATEQLVLVGQPAGDGS